SEFTSGHNNTQKFMIAKWIVENKGLILKTQNVNILGESGSEDFLKHRLLQKFKKKKAGKKSKGKRRINKTDKKKLLAIFAIFILFNTISLLFLYIIVNTPDNIPPNVKITTPTEGESVSGTTTISFTATDQQGFIKERQILIDGVLIQTSSYTYSWDTTQEIDGSHTILCRTKDKTVWGDDEITVIVDNSGGLDTTPPSVSISNPTAGLNVSGILTITMNATDANGINSYAIYIDGVFRSDTESYSWDTTQEIDGSYTILCEAIDPSGNIGSDTISVTVYNSEIIHEPSEIFKLMTFNIKDSGEAPAYPDWKNVVKEENADIIMFIETGYWDDNSDEKLNQYVNEFNTYFADEDPYIGFCTISDSYSGAAIMSRYPVIDYNQIDSVPLDNGSSYNVTHDLFDVEVNVSGTLIHVIGSHLKAFP
ncbi:hypothetical protein LCGC14_2747430, partial [marine sediment metagenome]